MRELLKYLASKSDGAIAAEYSFLIAFIAIVSALGMGILGTNLSEFFSEIGSALDNAGNQIPDLPFGS